MAWRSSVVRSAGAASMPAAAASSPENGVPPGTRASSMAARRTVDAALPRSTREREALLDELIGASSGDHDLARLLQPADDPDDAALGLLHRLHADRAEHVDLLD